MVELVPRCALDAEVLGSNPSPAASIEADDPRGSSASRSLGAAALAVAGASQPAADELDQLSGTERLGDEVVAAGRQRLLAVRPAAHRDDRQVAGRRVGLEPPRQLGAVDA